MKFVVDSRGVDEPNHYDTHDLRRTIPIKTKAQNPEPVFVSSQSSTTAILDAAEKRFRDIVFDLHSRLTVRMPAAEPVELSLEDIYVDLKVVAKVPLVADTFSVEERRILAALDEATDATRDRLWQEFDTLQFDRHRTFARINSTSNKPETLIELLADASKRAVVLLGDPGSGKTTLLHFLAIRSARSGTIQTTERGGVDEGKRIMPIFVPLAAYDAHVEETQPSMNLREYLAHYWEQRQQFRDAKLVFDRAFVEGRALVLLDGLDEIMTPKRRGDIVHQVELLIRNAQPGNRFVVTSRFVGYRQTKLPDEFEHRSVLDFGEREIELFLQRWYEALEARVAGGATTRTQNRAATEKEAAFAEIKANPHLLALAKNPLQLGMLALLRKNHERLPSRRVEIFNRFTAMLLELWPIDRSINRRHDTGLQHNVPLLRMYLRELALWMQQERPSRTATKSEVEGILKRTWLQLNANDPARPSLKESAQCAGDINVLLDELQRVTGIIIERGHDAFGFSHLTYQEFFVAEALANMRDEERWEILRPVLHQPRWREPLLLCVGYLGVISVQAPENDKLVRHVLAAGSAYESLLFRDVFWAASIAAEDVGLSTRVLNEIRDKL
ncbi:MAG TPA: NACHT domain-containing protein, partial [Polyangium sp.]|nr:NACHT domain-containing protein [Polyangium sp.]